MSVTAMKKLTVIAQKADADAIVRRLMRLRAVSLAPTEKTDGEPPTRFPSEQEREAAAARVARIEAILPLLNRRSKRKKPLFAQQTPISFEDFRDDGRYETAVKVVDETTKILERQDELKAALEAARANMRACEPYLNMELSPGFAGTETTVYLTGALPSGTRLERITAALEELAAEAEIISADGTGTYISLIAHRSDEEAALRALAGLGFMRSPLQGAPQTAKALFDDYKREKQRLEEELERLDTVLTTLAEKLTDVEILYDIERTDLMAAENKGELTTTEQCIILSGWCPAKQTDRIAELLEEFCAAYHFEDPTEGDDVPIQLKNNGFAKNFEWVLGMYAYPKYGTFDPTFVMSIFYFLIFGLMFADAGYGLVLMAACFGIVRWCHPREGMKRFLLMFGYCGISCFIFGVLFGAYFGNFPLSFMENVLGTPVNQMPNLSLLPTEAANLAILFDPLQNPMGFLVVSLAAGALHLVAGMAVKAFVLCRSGKPLDALFDICTYWLLFAGLGVLFVNGTVGLWLTVAGVASIVLTQGRRKKGFFGKLTGGLLGLYDLINYASDLLSYSRVLALGLAAGVIGQVINILATLKGGSFIGIILMIVVFCIGHLLNLVINVLGSFVHASRLQYIEFFNKFYEDGGTPFRPMTPSDRFTCEAPPAAAHDGSEAPPPDTELSAGEADPHQAI
ncbi:MAG: V-type ATP synthase subunit I [Clostridia bacterium]|nr:V-type ATP synthase subunit I [Clostridia bacterium]